MIYAHVLGFATRSHMSGDHLDCKLVVIIVVETVYDLDQLLVTAKAGRDGEERVVDVGLVQDQRDTRCRRVDEGDVRLFVTGGRSSVVESSLVVCGYVVVE